MNSLRSLLIAVLVAAALPAAAQTATTPSTTPAPPTPTSATSAPKVIGKPQAPRVVPSMIAKAAVVDAVVVLKSPKLEGDRLTFDVDVLEGDLVGGDGAASVFLDLINLPVARRTGHRAAWYHAATN